jgi:hypothetical protein
MSPRVTLITSDYLWQLGKSGSEKKSSQPRGLTPTVVNAVAS